MPTLSLSRSRGGRSRSTRRTTSTAPTMPRKNIKSAIGNKMNLLSDSSPATVGDIAKSQTKMGSASGTYGRHAVSASGTYNNVAVEDIAKSKAKLERSAHGIRKYHSSTSTPHQKKYQYVNLLPKRTTSTENNSYDDDEDYTYADGTATMATTALPVEAAVAGLLQSVRDVFKCVMHMADPQCPATGAHASGEVDNNNNNNNNNKVKARPSQYAPTDDDDTYGPPTKITVQPTPRGSKNRSRQNQFKRKPLVEDMESLVRVRLRKPLGIIFTSTSKDMKKGVRIYDLPRDGNAYRKAKPSLALGDQLLSVNGVDMTQRSFESAMNYINQIDTSKHKMDLIFRRASGQTRV